MATIRSVFSPGTTFNVLDPNAWVGGVVPGPNDIAQIGENGDYRASIHTDRSPYSTYAPPFSGSTIVKNQGSVIFPWEGNDVTIPVNSNAYNFNNEYQWPNTNGSFLIYPRQNTPDLRFPIKIDYISKSIDNTYTFQSCSIDRTYSNWVYKTGSDDLYDADLDEKGYPKEIYTVVRYNDYVYPLHTKFELTGSDTWHVGQIETLERCHFTLKDNATLKLDGSTVNPNAIYNNSDSYNNEIRILNNATLELTGSTQRTNAGFYFYNRGNSFNLIQISGSDLNPVTTLSQSANAGDSVITLTNTSSIGEGSIISIDNFKEPPPKYSAPVWDDSHNPYGYQGPITYPTGSLFSWRNAARGGINVVEGLTDKTNEVVQVISQSDHDYTIAKLFGKEGKIQEDLGTYTYEQFVQTFSGSLPIPYEGSKRAVLIDSLHKDFQPGEKLIISRSKVVDILYQDYYLSESLFLDFTNGATTESIHVSPYSGYTGSIVDVTTNGNYHLYYENYFRASQHWVTTPRTGSDGVTVTSSLHIEQGAENFPYQTNNPDYQYSYFLLPNTYFHEGEITINYDRNQNLNGQCRTQARLYCILGHGHRSNGLYPNQGSVYSSTQLYNFGNQDRYNYIGGRLDQGSSTLIGMRTSSSLGFPGLMFPNATDDYGRNSQDGYKQGKFTFKVDIKKGLASGSFNGQPTSVQHNVQVDRQPILFHARSSINIFDIRVKEYYQLVLLDTEESFDYKDEVLEGARLEYNQTAGKRVRASGNRIKDPLGYRNLTRDIKQNGKEATILPYMHSCTTTVAQDGNYNSFYNFASSQTHGGELIDHYLPIYDYGPYRYEKTGTGFYVIYDLQTEVSMSALAFKSYYDYNYEYTEMAGEPVGIEVSNDLENWTTVYAPTNDPRYTTRGGQLRFYDFTSGSISARFVKFSKNGSSRTTRNIISYLGLYNFYDENNQDMGNTIELYNADMFEVGDRIFFHEAKQPYHGAARFNYGNNQSYPGVAWQTFPGVRAGTTTDDDVCGGLTYLHTITAKNGNRITLDRKVANYPIYKDTFVYKWNQGSINFKGNHTNLGTWYNRRFYQGGNNNYQCINANFDHTYVFSGLDGGGADNSVLNTIAENVSINNVDDGNSNGLGANLIKNCNLVGGGSSAGIGGQNNQYGLGLYNVLVFNNVLHNFSWRPNGTFGPRIASYINHYTFNYNRHYGQAIQYIMSLDTSTNIQVPQVYNYKHNFVEATNSDSFTYMKSYLALESLSQNFKNVSYKDNYTFFTYRRMNGHGSGYASQARAVIAQNNPNLEPFKYYGLGSDSFYLHKSMYNYGSLIPQNSQIGAPDLYKNNPLTKRDDLVLFSRQYPMATICKEESGRYGIYPIDNAGYAVNNQANYNHPFLYYCKFSIYDTQDLKIYTNFDYFRPQYFGYSGNSWDNNRIRRGQYVEKSYYPRVTLLHGDTKKIIGKEELSYYGENTLTYNKTHTLTPGDYIFTLSYEDTSMWRAIQIFNHGPIKFNLFSTKPSKAEVHYNNWNVYELLDGKSLTPTEDMVATNAGKFKPLRASNTLPTGNIKIRTLKL